MANTQFKILYYISLAHLDHIVSISYVMEMGKVNIAMTLGVFAHNIDKSPIPQNFMSVVEMARMDRFSYRFINPRKGSNQHCFGLD